MEFSVTGKPMSVTQVCMSETYLKTQAPSVSIPEGVASCKAQEKTLWKGQNSRYPLIYVRQKVKVKVAHSCPNFCDPMRIVHGL